ncbi:hypothetical protein [Pseudolactococcus laudensis]
MGKITKLVKKILFSCEIGILSEKDYQIGKKMLFSCEIGILSEKDY